MVYIIILNKASALEFEISIRAIFYLILVAKFYSKLLGSGQINSKYIFEYMCMSSANLFRVFAKSHPFQNIG